MIGHLAYATGSPCPTLVLDARAIPDDPAGTIERVTAARRYLDAAGGGHVLKIALVKPSDHPMFDLDYRFVQALPEGLDRFDPRGSCGHSILAAVIAAERSSMIPNLRAGGRVRVRVLTTGESVICEMDRVGRSDAECTVYFMPPEQTPVDQLLLTGKPRTTLVTGGDAYDVSMVSCGNPYVFVDARGLGLHTPEALFGAGAELFGLLGRIRSEATAHLGWPSGGVFPKIAALLPTAEAIAVRAISVPSWHPTIALTGAVCLAAATRIPGTVTEQIARDAGSPDGTITIVTAGGVTTASATTLRTAGQTMLAWSSVGRKVVTYQGSFLMDSPAHQQFEEIARCLAETAKPL
ncbi:PrpF domain-containing protein [Actinoplanes sp. NPDC051494]|uniref:PrpF domain-containing protein n=1 Tax=Actinoplanes sp. NPDC051494 TaxID=3363907 RepID=UPI0037B2A04E